MPLSAVILLLIAGSLVGALVGWVRSLVSLAGTNRAIYLAIGTGAAGGLFGPLIVGMNSGVDSLLASMLGALLLVALSVVAEREVERRALRSAEHPNAGHGDSRERAEKADVEEAATGGEVTLRSEHVSVERRPVERPLVRRDLVGGGAVGADSLSTR